MCSDCREQLEILEDVGAVLLEDGGVENVSNNSYEAVIEKLQRPWLRSHPGVLNSTKYSSTYTVTTTWVLGWRSFRTFMEAIRQGIEEVSLNIRGIRVFRYSAFDRDKSSLAHTREKSIRSSSMAGTQMAIHTLVRATCQPS